MKRFLASCVLVGILSAVTVFSGCTTAQQGVGAGAMLGGATGAIIGHQRGRAGEGAAIGAGLGALAGGITGQAIDNKGAGSGQVVERVIAVCPNCSQKVDVSGIAQNTRVRCPHCSNTFTY